MGHKGRLGPSLQMMLRFLRTPFVEPLNQARVMGSNARLSATFEGSWRSNCQEQDTC